MKLYRVNIVRRKPETWVNRTFKYVLFFINFILWVLSAVLIGLMGWAIETKDKEVKDAYDFFLDPAIVLCLAGCLAFMVTSSGWWGALRENWVVLRVYMGFMVFIFILQLVFAILIFVTVYLPDVRDTLGLYPKEKLNTAITRYFDDDDLKHIINTFQETFGCCGTSNDEFGYKTWSANEYYSCVNVTAIMKQRNTLLCSVPYSCCKNATVGGITNHACGLHMQSSDKDSVRGVTIYTDGCFKVVSDLMHSNVLVIGCVMIGICLPQILQIYMAATLSAHIRRQRSK